MQKKIYILFITFLMTFVACKKDDEGTIPVVNISRPFENQFFNVGDTIVVTATVSDADLNGVSVALVDEGFFAVQSSVNVATNGKTDFTFTIEYPITNLRLESGTYHIRVQARTSKNQIKNKFKKIALNEIPRERLGIYWLNDDGGSVSVFERLDSIGFASFFRNLTGDYSSSSLSSFNQQLYVAGSGTGDFNGINLSDNSIAFTEPVINVGGAPYFTGVFDYEDRAYLSFFDGRFKAFDEQGITRRNYVVETDYYIDNATRVNNHFVVELVQNITKQSKISVFFEPTGSVLKDLPIQGEIVEMATINNNEVFIAGNFNDIGFLQIYDISANGTFTPVNLSSKLLDAVLIDDNNFLISTETGGMELLRLNPIGLVPYLPDTPELMLYDDLNNQVIISEGNQIKAYNFSTKAQVLSQSVSDAPEIIFIRYNK